MAAAGTATLMANHNAIPPLPTYIIIAYIRELGFTVPRRNELMRTMCWQSYPTVW